jgi:multidrug resistance efflux pump
MTQDWPAGVDYDPTWRPFKGATRFAPHPSSLLTSAELAWHAAYTRGAAIPFAGPALERTSLAALFSGMDAGGLETPVAAVLNYDAPPSLVRDEAVPLEAAAAAGERPVRTWHPTRAAPPDDVLPSGPIPSAYPTLAPELPPTPSEPIEPRPLPAKRRSLRDILRGGRSPAPPPAPESFTEPAAPMQAEGAPYAASDPAPALAPLIPGAEPDPATWQRPARRRSLRNILRGGLAPAPAPAPQSFTEPAFTEAAVAMQAEASPNTVIDPAIAEAPAAQEAEWPPGPTFSPPIPDESATPGRDFSVFRTPTPARPPSGFKLGALYRSTQVGDRPAVATPGGRRWLGRPIAVVAAVAGLVIAILLAIILPFVLSSPPTFTAMFTAPMLVLRAVGPGQITTVPVTIGQPVQPSTVLLTIHVNPLPDAVLDDMRSRLAQARTRQAALDDPAAPAAARRQKDAAAAEIDQMQKAIANAGGSTPVDQPILAGVRGIVWSLDAQPGAVLKAGDPLAQLADCGRAFLVVQEAQSLLKAGQTVLIRMPGLRPFHGTVRASAGVAEPAKTLVVEPTGFAAVSPNACPVGTSAEIQPEARS